MATNNGLNNNLSTCTGLVASTGINASGTPSSTTYLRGDNSWATAPGGSVTSNIQIFNTAGSSGTYTPTSGTKFIIVEMCGGGGGSGGASAAAGVAAVGQSGSCGSYLKFMMTAAQIGVSLSYQVGAIGTAGAAAGNGSSGGVTGFGTWVAGNGVGGLAQSAVGNTNGGISANNTSGTGIQILSTRGYGNPSSSAVVGTNFICNVGGISINALCVYPSGNSIYTFATAGSTNGTFAGGQPPGTLYYGYGARSQGCYAQASASSTTVAGVAGGGGLIIVTEFI